MAINYCARCKNDTGFDVLAIWKHDPNDYPEGGYYLCDSCLKYTAENWPWMEKEFEPIPITLADYMQLQQGKPSDDSL